MPASRDQIESKPRLKAYTKPTLTTYGQLKDLTTGGSGKSTEPSSGRKPRP